MHRLGCIVTLGVLVDDAVALPAGIASCVRHVVYLTTTPVSAVHGENRLKQRNKNIHHYNNTVIIALDGANVVVHDLYGVVVRYCSVDYRKCGLHKNAGRWTWTPPPTTCDKKAGHGAVQFRLGGQETPRDDRGEGKGVNSTGVTCPLLFIASGELLSNVPRNN